MIKCLLTGNVEYKRCLVCTEERLEKLTSQLKWRLREGNGEAHYFVGVDDDGTPVGLSKYIYWIVKFGLL